MVVSSSRWANLVRPNPSAPCHRIADSAGALRNEEATTPAARFHNLGPLRDDAGARASALLSCAIGKGERLYQFVVESLQWERIELIVRGRVADLDAPEAGVSAQIYLEDDRTLDSVPVPAPEIEGDCFTLRFKIMQAVDLYPLVTGDWYFVVKDAEGASVPCARLAPDFSCDIAGWGGLFTTPNWRYWVAPAVNRETGGFGLSVTYGRAAARQDLTRGERFLVKSRSRMRRMRESLFVGLFNLARDLVPKNGKRMLFTSDSREDLSGNLETIHTRMLERGLDQQFDIYMSFKPSIHDRRGLLDKFRFTYYLGIADVIVVDDFHPMIYKVRFSPGVKIVQVWHASGAFKTVGYSRIGKPGGPNPFSRSHKAYTHAIVSSEHDRRFYSEAFGIRVENVIPTGIPRMDLLFDSEYKARSIELVHESIPRRSADG